MNEHGWLVVAAFDALVNFCIQVLNDKRSILLYNSSLGTACPNYGVHFDNSKNPGHAED